MPSSWLQSHPACPLHDFSWECVKIKELNGFKCVKRISQLPVPRLQQLVEAISWQAGLQRRGLKVSTTTSQWHEALTTVAGNSWGKSSKRCSSEEIFWLIGIGATSCHLLCSSCKVCTQVSLTLVLIVLAFVTQHSSFQNAFSSWYLIKSILYGVMMASPGLQYTVDFDMMPEHRTVASWAGSKSSSQIHKVQTLNILKDRHITVYMLMFTKKVSFSQIDPETLWGWHAKLLQIAEITITVLFQSRDLFYATIQMHCRVNPLIRSCCFGLVQHHSRVCCKIAECFRKILEWWQCCLNLKFTSGE